MTGSRLWAWILAALLVAGIGLVIAGAIAVNGTATLEGVYVNSSGGSAQGVFVEQGSSGTGWFVAGFALLALSFLVAARRGRPGR